jgi:hypothetical protein
VSDPPKIPPPIPVELDDIYSTGEQDPSFVLKFEDGTRLIVQFPTDSPEAQEFLRFLTEAVNSKVQAFASRGLEITGFAPSEDD